MTEASFLRDNARWLGAGALLAFSSSFGQTYFIGLFAGHIQADFGLSHGEWGSIYALGTTLSALAMLWSGALADRFRIRALAVFVLCGLALACLAMALNPIALLLPLVIFGLRLMGQGMTSHLALVAMGRWFVRTRGRALAIATLGFSAGEALLPLIFVALMGVLPWRSLWVVAALMALTAIPILWVLLRQERTPASMAAENQSTGLMDRHWTRGQVLRHPLFWLTLPARLAPPAFVTAFFFLQVHLAEAKGWAHLELVALFPLYTLTTIAALLASGWAIDRFGTGRLLPYSQIPLALAFLLVGTSASYGAAGLGMMLIGLTIGMNSTLAGSFWAEYFGTRNLGSIKALGSAIMVLGSAIGPALTGVLIDKGIAFPAQMSWIAVYILGASALVWIGLRQAGPINARA